jgi:hypothetical protein
MWPNEAVTLVRTVCASSASGGWGGSADVALAGQGEAVPHARSSKASRKESSRCRVGWWARGSAHPLAS